MKNIAYISRPINPPWDEGSKNFVYSLSSYIQHYRILLLTSQQNCQADKYPNIEMIRVYSGKHLNHYQKLKLIYWLLTTKQKIDLIHSFFTPRLITSRFLKWGAFRHDARFIHTIPTLSALEKHRHDTFSYADVLVAMSDYTLRHLQQLGCENARRIYPGVDTERFSPFAETNSLDEQLETLQNTPVVLYAGEYKRLRSFDNLLSWIPEVARRVPEAKFIFAVRIKQKEEYKIEQRIKQKVENMGLSQRILFLRTVENMPALHRLATIHVFPVQEMFGKFDLPMVLLEAMACGCPILTSENVPLKELFKGDIGFQIPYKDVHQWTEVVVDLLKNYTKCQQIGREGRRVAKKWFDIKTIANQYQTLYEEIL